MTTPMGNTPRSLVALSLRPERPGLIRKWPGCGASWSGVSWSFGWAAGGRLPGVAVGFFPLRRQIPQEGRALHGARRSWQW